MLLHGGFAIPAQFAVYRASFLRENKLKFMRGIYHEDAEFKPRFVYLAQKVRMLKGIVYNYLLRKEGSITSCAILKRCQDILTVNDSLRTFSEKIAIWYQMAFNRHIGMNMNSLLSLYWNLPRNDREKVRGMMKCNRIFLRG